MKRGLLKYAACIILMMFSCRAAFSGCRNVSGKSLSHEMCVHVIGGDCFISSKSGNGHDIIFHFRKCMANNLYTFYRVGILSDNGELPVGDPERTPDMIVNEAYSDNIGPFLVEGRGWCGGNHTGDGGKVTAYNKSHSITIDGNMVAGDTLAYVKSLTINVTNVILDTFAIEKVRYDVYPGVIEVSAKHEFLNNEPLTVSRYYGMQSMFNGETETLTPGGLYSSWTPENKVSSFPMRDFPDFRWFVERNSKSFQSSYLFRCGMGDHSFEDPDEPVFIGNSNGKSYHRLMAGHVVKKGDETFWKGVYTWQVSPCVDNDHVFGFFGTIDSKPALYVAFMAGGSYSFDLPEGSDSRKYNVLDLQGPVKISRKGRKKLTVSSSSKGYSVIIFD